MCVSCVCVCVCYVCVCVHMNVFFFPPVTLCTLKNKKQALAAAIAAPSSKLRVCDVQVIVLQCVVVCCSSVLRSVAVCGSLWQCDAVCSSVLQCAAVCGSVLQCAAVCCSI